MSPVCTTPPPPRSSQRSAAAARQQTHAPIFPHCNLNRGRHAANNGARNFHLPFVCEEGGEGVLAEQSSVARERVALERSACAEIADDEVGTGVFALDAEESAA